MKKIFASILAFLLLVSVFNICAVSETIYDQAGRQLILSEVPERIVSGYYISTSALLALQLKSKLVGIEAKAAKRALYQKYAPEMIELPSVGSAKQFDLEACAALEPDLVILPVKLKEASETLEALGIPVMLVNPENQASLKEMIVLIGKTVSADSAAEALLNAIEVLENDLTAALKNSDKPSVYIASNSAFLSTAGAKMYQSDLITLAGGQNAASEINGNYWENISYEQLLAWNPDYILLPSDASYTVQDVLDDTVIASLSAIQQNRVLQMPGDIEAWDSPVPGSMLGAWWLASQLHPDCVTVDAYEERVQQYYDTFYQAQ